MTSECAHRGEPRDPRARKRVPQATKEAVRRDLAAVFGADVVDAHLLEVYHKAWITAAAIAVRTWDEVRRRRQSPRSQLGGGGSRRRRRHSA